MNKNVQPELWALQWPHEAFRSAFSRVCKAVDEGTEIYKEYLS